jgi:tryptophan synthase alpha subunit
MKLLDWTCPSTIRKFKENVQTRLLVFNELILFHDAQSFLEACLEAGIIDSLIVDPDYVPLKTNVQYMRLETNENDLRFD